MKLKADWSTWLHTYKEREIEKAFSGCSRQCFDYGLEIGAGDGFQSRLLSKYLKRLVSTEINESLLSEKNGDGIEYGICCAEEAIKSFKDGSFDIVFSSNLLEHLTDPLLVLCGLRRILKDDGITVHIVPTPFWKLCHMLFYTPANAMALMEHLSRQKGAGNRLRELRFMLGQLFAGALTGSNTLTKVADCEERLKGNNPKTPQNRPAFFKRLFLPQPHGISENNLAEFEAFRRRRWINLFEQAGFQCVAVYKGPAASGYGLGWGWAERMVEKLGIASELIYIAQKKGRQSKYLRYFSEQ